MLLGVQDFITPKVDILDTLLEYWSIGTICPALGGAKLSRTLDRICSID